MKTRGSGILLHITSLPTKFGIGDLGPVAHEFIEFLQKAGQRYWQILPIHPTDEKYDNSPYHSLSAFAGNPLLISPEFLVEDGFLDDSDLFPIPEFNIKFVDFPSVISYKNQLFDMAYHRFKFFGHNPEFTNFCREQSWWLDDYALFMVIRSQHPDTNWSDWPLELKNRNDEYLKEYTQLYYTEIEKVRFIQYLFSLQWEKFLKKCHDCGIWLIGDIPIYIDYDSSDVWSNPIWFQLDENKRPIFVAGVPPDYFSETGQIWNNPLYAWERIENDNFTWWRRRIHKELQGVDFLRIDHFRGLAAFWEIPAGSDTAIQGRWVNAPAWKFLQTMEKNFPYLPIIAEDLGIITPDVREILREFNIPGMNVLQFAFSSDTSDNPYILHNIKKESLVYTGTHDNNTTLGWFLKDSTDIEKQRLFSYIGKEISSSEICEVFIRLAMMSNANTAIIPIQDILNLDESARMNRPGIDTGNWKWKMQEKMLTDELTFRLRALSKIYGRY
ncbi:4-alpha-glucanotransferase [Methanospirillum stamsii]|uniref:4-alpha-glucanotransferase n=1 Tax=Methanospirillum stamsii TaxID=1277351 RepID=A0A2V2NCA3_9EURY|nr:4-alpha-glucanotransferase [Methanospirillum stamsii]PWR75236.1 4-alpha-glucanotransferase [Methanospirillum stamsii]